MRISHGVRKVLLFGALMTSGCAAATTAPKPRIIEDTASVSASYDETWSAVIETFADLNLTIENLEKDSGLITTDWITFGGAGGKEYCDCGGGGFGSGSRSPEGKFNVFVKEEGEGVVKVKVTTTYRRPWSVGRNAGIDDCFSTGSLESKIHDAVREKL